MRTGILRKVDDLGRVVIPAGVRRSLNIREGDEVEVSVEGEQVILAKPIEQCVFCGSVEELSPFRSKRVCRPCLAGLGVMDGTLRTSRARGDGATPAEDGENVLPPWSIDEQPAGRTDRSAPTRVAATDSTPPRTPSRPDPTPTPTPQRQDGVESTTAW